MVGKKILHYKILEKLGEGGMGVVYLAEDTKLERNVAIKFLPSHIASDSNERNRFEIEAKASAALNHPNISTIYSIEHSDNDVFLVMEYIEGVELRQYIRDIFEQADRDDMAEMTERINIAIQIAKGLEAAHDKGIVHRDIKSSNIMITPRGDIKIMDFGLAKFRGSAQLTKQGTTVGTAAYMSPEQARGEDTNIKADIWSFGVVLYELISGALPYKGDYEQAVIYAILNEEPVLNAYPEIIPEELKKIVNICLTKNPEERYNSCSEILKELTQLVGSSQSIKIPQSKQIKTRTVFTRAITFLTALAVIIAIAVFVYLEYDFQKNAAEARDVLLPQIEQLAADMPWTGEGMQSWQAFGFALKAQEYLAGDPYFEKVQEKYTAAPAFNSDPPGADVYVKPYSNPDADWYYLGQTPIDSSRLPISLVRIKLEKKGFETLEDIIWIWTSILNHEYSLTSPGEIPDGMVKATGGKSLGSFYIDRFEVKNKDYKKFIDQGGYKKQEYWKYEIYHEGKLLSWKEAMSMFVDKTGVNGPATWEVGEYPQGMDDYPVPGVSWYEAAAYAEFAGKELPTLRHWRFVADLGHSAEIIPFSNINGSGPIQVGTSRSMNRFGVYDMAGNVREWCWNKMKRGGHRLILGGAWNDAEYLFNQRVAQDPFDRSQSNGIRCIKYLTDHQQNNGLTKELDIEWPDYSVVNPVSDDVFKKFTSFYSYDKRTPQARIELEEVYNDEWRRQVVVIDAAYNNEDLPVNIFFPKESAPPYQAIVYFPGSGSTNSLSSKKMTDFRQVDFFLKSGRVVVYPIYKGTYERKFKGNFWNKPIARRNMIINWMQDYSRVIDYLETREDINSDKLAYYGFSMGGWVSPMIMATERRLKAGIIYVAGFIRERLQPEVDALNYAPRVKIPVLMLNGRFDSGFPVEKSQRPLYNMLGTPKEFKKWVLYDNGHSVPRPELIKESLNWLDKYLGPVQ